MIGKIRIVVYDYMQEVLHAFRMFSRREKYIFLACLSVFCLSVVSIGWLVNAAFIVEIPAYGGTLDEGDVGIPRFVNPVLATSDPDRDLTALVYSGLMRVDPHGKLIPDLAQDYSISDDGLTYTFTLRQDLLWHDGSALSADDIAFTIKKIQDPAIKSPRHASWEGVGVEAPNAHTVIFTLKHPYGAFLENTTIGILPKHIWDSVPQDSFSFSQWNSEPIGSGPYKIHSVERSSSGVPELYELVPFAHFALGKAYIETLRMHFYPNEEALVAAYQAGSVDSMSTIAPETALAIGELGKQVLRSTVPLPRVFAVFFNQNQQRLFTDSSVRKALAAAVDKDALIDKIFKGYAAPINGPIPPGALGYKNTPDAATTTNRVETAREILRKGGWTLDTTKNIFEKTTTQKGGKKETTELAFSLSTADTAELKDAAEAIKRDWEALGARVDLKVFEVGDLNQNIIRPRKYDALFFGEIVGRDPDPFAFWHSSQRNDPGLNVALYANQKVDTLVEKARATANHDERAGYYRNFQDELAKDIPAVFIYAPYFLYVIPKTVHNVDLSSITVPSERFLHSYSWYIDTDEVWRIFAPSENKH